MTDQNYLQEHNVKQFHRLSSDHQSILQAATKRNCLYLTGDGFEACSIGSSENFGSNSVYRLCPFYELPKDEEPPETLTFDLDWSRGHSSFTPLVGTISTHVGEGFEYKGYAYSFDHYWRDRSCIMKPSFLNERATKIVFRRWGKVTK